MPRNPLKYLLLILTVMLLGLSSRRLALYLPNWLNLWLGDALWALMVYFMTAFLLRKSKISRVALGAVFFSFAVEFSQLYHPQWLDALRQTRLGGLILGYEFLWSDLVAYTMGIGVGMLLEALVIARGSSDRQ